ncbi:carboxymuconolactone decarboxylase family protein [Kineosporia babensis]|uniref:Carboxymuconolactone decarboxylase family protein n=1 Tax=Kineosporia babensis TaxID=499548 RepID=A0A9X1SXZ3_9ACTN|nr:hypothetical protein [Kineosporia babensis]MCD5315745.1 hypothetical protein [Kineosporia babensis]
MPPRMKNPSLVVPDALQPLLDLSNAIGQADVPKQTLDLVRLYISHLNGRQYQTPSSAGSIDERLLKVSQWRSDPSFTPAERAALALAESCSQLGSRTDPVPDEVWDAAAEHFTEQQLGALVLQIALVNLWNCVNVSTRQEPADWR